MADNVQVNVKSTDGAIIAAAQMSFSGDTTDFQIVGNTILTGSEGSWAQTLIVGGAGAVTGGVQRMTLASDDPAVALLTTMDVDTSAMAVDLAALEVLVTAGNVDLAAIEVLLTAANVDHAANEVLLTTIASDTTSLDGKVTACDTGAVVISSGTVTANAGTNLNTSALALETGGNLAAIATSVSGVATDAKLDDIIADTAAIQTAVEIMDDWDESDRAKVNVIAGQAGVAAGEGVDGATVQRMTLATDVALPAGSNAIGKLAANSGVDIGDVDVTSIVPGVGATNLGKAEDAVHASGDVGVMSLGVRVDLPTAHAPVGDYAPITISEHGCVNVDAQHYHTINDADATTGWTVLNNDTDNLTTSTNHVWKTASLSFDKVDGAGDTAIAAIQRSVSSTSFNGFIEEGGGFFLVSMYLSTIADVDYAFLRVGTDSSNYNEWRVQDDSLMGGEWNAIRAVMRAPFVAVGNGWNSSAVTWLAVGVAFDGETDTLAEILVDGLFANSGLQTSADITSQVSTSVSSPNVAVTNWHGSVPTGAGVVTSGTQRVTLGSNDPAVTALELLDNAVSGAGYNITQFAGAAVPIGAGVEAAALRVTLATDSTGTITVDTTGTSGLEVVQVTAADLNMTEASASDIKTAVQLIDNPVQVFGTDTYTEATDSGMMVGAVRNDDLATLADTDNEVAPLQVDNQGALYVNQAAAEPKRASGVAAGGAPATDDIIAAVASRTIRILALGLFATSATANNVFLDNADHDLLFNSANPLPLSIDADGDTVAGFVLPYNPGGWFETDTVNEAVTLNSSAAQDIAWTVTYIEVA